MDRLAPIPGFLPGWQPHLLSGPPGGGKTALIASWVRHLLEGWDIFGKPVATPPWIGVLAADREWEDSRQWYDQAGIADLPSFSLVDSALPLTQFVGGELKLLGLLEKIIVEELQPLPNGLLILDPISLWAGGDMNRYKAVYIALMGLSRLCLRLQITIIGLAHTAKQRQDPAQRYTRPQDRISGSAALLGCSGTQMALETPDQTGETWRFSWVPHHAPSESYDLERDAATGLFLLEAPRSLPTPTDAAATPAPELPLPDAFRRLPGPEAPPMSASNLLRVITAAGHGVSQATLYRALGAWQDQGLVEAVGKRYRRRVTN